MPQMLIHHVALVTRDLDRAVAFYEEVFGLVRLERPPFATKGVWFACGAQQVHIIEYEPGSFRAAGVDVNDGHFAFHTDDFEGMVDKLRSLGFSEDAGPDDLKRIVINRNSLAGFAQVYLLDPDRNIIEINAAP